MFKSAAYQPASSPIGGPAANRKKTNLGKEAVKAALKGEWERAVAMNRSILEINPGDCEASNRLAKALMELKDYAEARRILENLCARAPGNNIARKNLARLEQLQVRGNAGRSAALTDDALPRMFIADSGKSCITTLQSQVDATAAATVSAGDAVRLSANAEGIMVISREGSCLGKIERRLARRLHKLMDEGNQYAAAVVGTGAEGLSIIVRETWQHPALRHVVSFPPAPGRAGQYPPAMAETSEVVAHDDDYAESIGDEATAGMAGEATIEEESAAVALADEVGDDSDEPDAVPVLDTDVASENWPHLKTVMEAETDADWE